MWGISIGDKGEGKTVVSMQPPGGPVLRWSFFRGPTKNIMSGKNTDLTPSSFGVRAPDGHSLSDGRVVARGSAQVHSSKDGEIHATIQDGRHNNTFRLFVSSGGAWRMAPAVRGRRLSLSKQIASSAMKSAGLGAPPAKPQPSDWLAAPLVAPPGKGLGYSMGLAALLGGGAAGAGALGLKAYDGAVGNDSSRRPSAIRSAMLGALGGAGVSLFTNSLLSDRSAPRSLPGLPLVRRGA